MPKSKLADSGHNAQRPYDRPIMSTKSSQVRPERSMLDLPQVKSQTSASTSTSTRKTKKGEYDKTLIVTLVLKTAKDVKWESIVTEIGKTTTQCKDVWRKVIHPSIIANRPWANEGTSKGWTKFMKIRTFLIVLEACTPDWDGMTQAFPGKSKSQIKDIWRKVILPRLRRGDTIE
ncbi:uncharacterized protein I303_103777 [Kwoniella dejecticola CBS 10117]|uniref:Myb-like domain-containing protein n=1 Tax=Kwoniella dejecticola CBS 10117 TaxID=1296121 RepID=A0AAJ8KMQ5_9TREE